MLFRSQGGYGFLEGQLYSQIMRATNHLQDELGVQHCSGTILDVNSLTIWAGSNKSYPTSSDIIVDRSGLPGNKQYLNYIFEDILDPILKQLYNFMGLYYGLDDDPITPRLWQYYDGAVLIEQYKQILKDYDIYKDLNYSDYSNNTYDYRYLDEDKIKEKNYWLSEILAIRDIIDLFDVIKSKSYTQIYAFINILDDGEISYNYENFWGINNNDFTDQILHPTQPTRHTLSYDGSLFTVPFIGNTHFNIDPNLKTAWSDDDIKNYNGESNGITYSYNRFVSQDLIQPANDGIYCFATYREIGRASCRERV